MGLHGPGSWLLVRKHASDLPYMHPVRNELESNHSGALCELQRCLRHNWHLQHDHGSDYHAVAYTLSSEDTDGNRNQDWPCCYLQYRALVSFPPVVASVRR